MLLFSLKAHNVLLFLRLAIFSEYFVKDKMPRFRLYTVLFITILCACHPNAKEGVSHENYACNSSTVEGANYYGRGALLASRFNSLEELKTIISIEWAKGGESSLEPHPENNLVKIKHCSEGQRVTSILKAGVSQSDIIEAKDGNLFEKVGLVVKAPYAVAHRKELKQVYILSRRFSDIFSVEDVAFYYIAEASVRKIMNKNEAFLLEKDQGEKGYINTFNHMTAQAMITSIFSKEFADFVADVHELKNMPELTSGMFSQAQLVDEDNNPIDNYIDMINNEWGQEIGMRLKEKYRINSSTIWTAELLANYLNELQAYYSWAFQLEMEPFRANERIVNRFKDKINSVLQNEEMVSI